MITLHLSCLAACCLLACGRTEAPPSTRVESSDLGVAFASVPAAFALERNNGTELRFTVAGEAASKVWLERGEVENRGINLVEIVNRQRVAYEGLAGGEFFGSRELVTQLGPAYYSRGRFDADGERQEEVRVFLLHPSENRLLTLHYRYPAADDSSERLSGLLGLLSELEGLTVPATPAPE